MQFLVRILLSAVVAFALSRILPGVHLDGFWTAIVLSLVLALLDAVIKPLLILLTLPITLVTLGLFLFVINALIILLAAHLVRGFSVDGFGWALLFSLLFSFLSALLYRQTKGGQ